MAIVSCPECSKRLKVADTSVGKKVKCSCGRVFVAEPKDAAPARALEAAPEKLLVACSECGANLKVATTSLGKRMKCPKCAGVFIASAEEEAPAPPPAKKAMKPPPKPAELFEEDDAPTSKSKPGQKGAKPPRSGEDHEDAGKKPVYPRRTVLNLVVFLLLIVYITFFALVFLDIVPLGFPKHKGPVVKGKKFVPDQETEEEKKTKEQAAAAENKKEAAKLEGTWTVDSAETNGKALDEWKGKKLTFSGEKATVPFSKGGSFKVDASKAPKWIDITTVEELTVLAIYKLDGDEMQLCTSVTKVLKDGKEVWQASERPTQFDSKQGMLVVLKREK